MNGSIQKGIVQHVEYTVQIESEIFLITGDSITAMSSATQGDQLWVVWELFIPMPGISRRLVVYLGGLER